MNMKESMMTSLVIVCTQMNKLVLLIPLFFITMCGEAPVTPPAQACSPRLDGKPTYCPDERDLILVKPVEYQKSNLKERLISIIHIIGKVYK